MVLLNPGSSPYFEFWFANSFDSRSDKPELKLNNKFTVSFGTKYKMEMSQTLINDKVELISNGSKVSETLNGFLNSVYL